jgi:hypothetical protein
MVPFAHAGHWIEAAVYMVPIGGFAVWLGITTVRDRRKEREEQAAAAASGSTRSEDDAERTAET